MSTILAVPSAYATITAAIAAIPATTDDQYIVEINGETQFKFTESPIIDKITTETNNIIVRAATDRIPIFAGIFSVYSNAVFTKFEKIGTAKNNTYFTIYANDCTFDRCLIRTYNGAYLRTIGGTNRCTIKNSFLEMKGLNIGGLRFHAPGDGHKILNCHFLSINNELGRAIIHSYAGVSNVKIQNNIFTSVFGAGVFIQFADEDPTGLVLDYNQYSYDDVATIDLYKFNATVYSTVAALNTAKPALEANSIEVSQQVLPFQSFRYNWGTGVADADVLTDFYGDNRTGAMQMGPVDIVEADVTVPTWDGGGTSEITSIDTGDSQEVSLSWNTAIDLDSGLEGYEIYYSTIEGNVISDGIRMIVPAGINSTVIGGLTNGVQHWFTARARDKAIIPNSTTNTDTSTATPTNSGAIIKKGPYTSTLKSNAQFISVRNN